MVFASFITTQIKRQHKRYNAVNGCYVRCLVFINEVTVVTKFSLFLVCVDLEKN